MNKGLNRGATFFICFDFVTITFHQFQQLYVNPCLRVLFMLWLFRTFTNALMYTFSLIWFLHIGKTWWASWTSFVIVDLLLGPASRWSFKMSLNWFLILFSRTQGVSTNCLSNSLLTIWIKHQDFCFCQNFTVWFTSWTWSLGTHGSTSMTGMVERP